jgi:hypothetical protein
MLTYYCIAGKSPNMTSAHLKYVREFSGFDRVSMPHELLVIIYRNKSIPEIVTNDLKEVCVKNGARWHLFEERTDDFLSNLYQCWNLGYEQANGDWVFRSGNDQVFSRDAFLNLERDIEVAKKHVGHEDFVLQANTVENGARNLDSRHLLGSFGSSFEELNIVAMNNYFTRLSQMSADKRLLTTSEAEAIYGKPTGFTSSLGYINRTDGCSWLMSKKAWLEHGPMPSIENGITGDVIIHDRLQTAGYQNFLLPHVLTYHFVQGERLGGY